ncbi:unnamed protein product [Rotaria magnacalcarata]|uniref:TAFH domain-containing protein n=6 Tax=Rotaria magnacalcarata TaxID=392030 RepID=A0A818YIX1_9BILA|nr:unnamed protein product [Rotaria magnacalcarata]CAF2228169.1 unnamed protein product [Rotaria magnacalcarata]CAF3754418.1 unnamed protein product [Rotaria magnacalcarata]CAF4038544.1 unnamed protein product [Rotaria magnacalcarata]
MTSSSSPFSNTTKFQVLPTPTTLLFTQPVNNNITINNIGNAAQNIRQTNTQNGTYIHHQQQQQSMSSGTITTPTNIVRLNQTSLTQNQFGSQTIWTNNPSQSSPKIQYSMPIQKEIPSPVIQQQSSILPTKLVTQPVVRQTVTAQQAPKFTDAQINDFVAKCRTFLTTLLKLAEKQAPEKLPMVRSCIQDLLDGTIDPESFTQRLHTLYKSQPHTSLVPFFKLALPHMRQMVKNTFGRPITIELLEKLNLPSSKSTPTTTAATTPTTTSRVVVNPSLLTQQSTSGIQQPLLYTTVQPQQKINLLQQNSQSGLFSSTASLLGQQQQLQQQARAQINITGIRPIVASVSPSSNTNLLSGQQQIQPVSQTIIQPSDSILQRTFLSPSATHHQPQIITVNHQSIRTEIVTSQPTSLINTASFQQPQAQIQIQPKITIKNDDESTDDIHGNNGLLTAAAAPVDDRHTRHIAHDSRLLTAPVLRRRFDHLIKKDKRSEGGNITIHDDSVLALISHATEERLKYIIEQIKSISQLRGTISTQVTQNQQTNNDSEDINQKQAETIHIDGLAHKRKFEENTKRDSKVTRRNSSVLNLNKKFKLKRHPSRANIRDLIIIMESDKHLKRSSLLFKALDRSS